MILDDDASSGSELGKLGEEVGERAVPVDSDDAGVPADVAELVVMRPREDTAAEAAHQANTRSRVVVVLPSGRRVVGRHRVDGAQRFMIRGAVVRAHGTAEGWGWPYNIILSSRARNNSEQFVSRVLI